MSEPIDRPSDGKDDAKKEFKHPEETLFGLSKLLVIWIFPLIKTARERQLRDSDVWPCPTNQNVEHDSALLWSSWNAEKLAAQEQNRNPSLIYTLWRGFKSDILISGSYQLSFALTQLSQPYLVGELVTYVATGNGGIKYGISLAIGLILISLTSSLALTATLYNNRRLGVAVRSAIMMAVYEQALKLTASSRLKMTVGTITSLMAIDAEKLFLAAQFGHFLWHGPIASLAVMALLTREVGWAASLAGLAWICLLIPMQTKLAAYIGTIRRAMVASTDERVKLTNEILTTIRAIKFYAWEVPLGKRVLAARSMEVRHLNRYLAASSYLRELLIVAGPIATLVIFTVVVYNSSAPMTVSQVFKVLAFINILRFPLNLLAQSLKNCSDANVSLGRLGRFFTLPVLVSRNHTETAIRDDAHSHAPYISIINSSFCWTDEGDASIDPFRLQSLTFTTSHSPTALAQSTPTFPSKKNELIAIIGPVGSGKSTFFSSILSETICTEGSAPLVYGTVAYCAQSPWIQNQSLRNNVLFGASIVNEENYRRALQAAALGPDLAILPTGDETEIGERGISLSGGQKARVSLARAFYAAFCDNAQILLLDDPFSAVDSTTAQLIFELGVKKLCTPSHSGDEQNDGKNKIVLVALNSHIHLLNQFDRVLVFDQGKVAADFRPQDSNRVEELRPVLRRAGVSASGLSEMCDVSVTAAGDAKHGASLVSLSGANEKSESSTVQQQDSETVDLKNGETGDIERAAPEKLIKAETRAIGSVSYSYYFEYFSAGFARRSTFDHVYSSAGSTDKVNILYGMTVAAVLVALFTGAQFFRIAIDYSLAVWAQSQGARDSDWGTTYYAVFGGCVAMSILRSLWLNYFSVKSADAIHRMVFCRILQAPINDFFDTHTVGEVLNKLSKDTEVMDSSVPEFMLQVLINWWQVASIFGLAIWAAPWIVILLTPMAGLFYQLFVFFSCTSRDLKRMESMTRSPIYSSLSETLTGLDTIRAYAATGRFLSQHRAKMETNQKYFFHLWMATSWMTGRLEISTSIILFAVALLCVCLRETSSPVSLGLALSYGLQLTALFQRCMQVSIDVSTYMTSVERILEYRKLTIEQDTVEPCSDFFSVGLENVAAVSADNHEYSPVPLKAELPPDWPPRGEIEFKGVSMRYRDNTPLALNNVSFTIHSGEMIGVCGRTGSGKSSLIVSLFRIVEILEGSILIDGIDIRSVPLTRLRSSIAIIPQDPTLLTGTIRFQLDPMQKFSDVELYNVLAAAAMDDHVRSLPDGLDEKVSEGGENLSHGQRQLLCIARALLRSNRILVIDEGTSSVDPGTDELIQRTFRLIAKRTGCTIICVAHRISTILDFDRILCISGGHVQEFGTPAKLLSNKDSMFAALVDSFGVEHIDAVSAVRGIDFDD